MSTVLSEVCQSAEICGRVPARFLLITDHHSNNFKQCDIFSAERISPSGLFELHWMMYVQYGLMCIICIFVLVSH